MFYHFKIHKEPNGYWAESIELKGCVTQADSLEQLYLNMEEALNLYLNEPENAKVTFPLPQRNIIGKNIVKISVDPKIAFAMKMKIFRSKKGLSQRQVADLLGMKNIYSYQRLESAKKANPNLSTIARIKEVFPEFNIDEIFINNKPKHKHL